LILGIIVKIVAIRCHILKLKCTEFDFGWGSAPDPTRTAYSAHPDPLAGFKGGATSNGRDSRKKDGREWKGRREERGSTSKTRGKGRREGRRVSC